MIKSFLNYRLIKLLLMACLLPPLHAKKKEWSSGHGDMVIDFVNNEWVFRVIEDDDPEEVVIVLGPEAKLSIPDNPVFSFLGEPEAPVWVIPQTAAEEVVYMGIETLVPPGTFQNNRMDLLLSSVSGPGHFIMWVTSGPAEVQVVMNSRDGITEADRDANRPAPGHWHQNWGFTAPGTYKVGFQASAVPAGGSAPVVSSEAIYTFEVNVLKSGEVDLEIEFEDGEWELVLHDETRDQEFEADEAALRLGPATWQRVPSHPSLAFLGNPGSPIYLLPQDEREGLLFLGISGAHIEPGVFVNDRVFLHLVGLEGPGDFFLYRIEPLGETTVFVNTREGISSADRFPVAAGVHAHQNWVFTEPGFYRVKVRASGTLAANNQMSRSEVTELFFEVFAPVFLREGEVEIEIEYEENALRIGVLDEETDRHFSPEEVVLQVGIESRQSVPADPSFAFLGEAGQTIYLLPQDEHEEVLFLGISGDEIPEGLFVNNRVALNLKEFSGPGEVFLYSLDAFGAPTIYFNSADGISSADSFPVVAGAHSHQNWAFTRPGVYRVTLQAEGALVGGGTVESEEHVFTFDILDDEPSGISVSISPRDQQTMRINWDSVAGAVYQLQSRQAFGVGDWVDDGAPKTGTGQQMEMELGFQENGSRFFRLKKMAE
jgi:surface-anchored protein